MLQEVLLNCFVLRLSIARLKSFVINNYFGDEGGCCCCYANPVTFCGDKRYILSQYINWFGALNEMVVIIGTCHSLRLLNGILVFWWISWQPEARQYQLLLFNEKCNMWWMGVLNSNGAFFSFEISKTTLEDADWFLEKWGGLRRNRSRHLRKVRHWYADSPISMINNLPNLLVVFFFTLMSLWIIK